MINQDLKVSELLSIVESVKSAARHSVRSSIGDDANATDKDPTVDKIVILHNKTRAEVRANFSVNLNVGITL